MANQKLEGLLGPVRDWLEQLARRLDIEADMNYRAQVNARNHHGTPRLQAEDDALEFERNKPAWVDKTGKLVNPALDSPPSKSGWPDIGEKAGPPLRNAFETFKRTKAVTLQSGERLYRVVAPNSFDNSICWMREAEFLALSSRDDWRRRFAVWRYWNRNGEYVVYTVPPGKGLNAWEGPAASQQLKNSNYVLEGGAVQIVLDPRQLQPEHLSRRRPTQWGYSDFPGESDEFLGLPKLTNHIDGRNLPPDSKLDL